MTDDTIAEQVEGKQTVMNLFALLHYLTTATDRGTCGT
jgi:hypothetical protein